MSYLPSKLTLFLLCGGLTLSSFAAEVDSFTKRSQPLNDSLEAINHQTNLYLQEAVDMANDEDKGCDEMVLYKKMRKYFSNQYRGKLGAYIVDAIDLDKHPMTIDEGIYQDFKWYQSFIQGFYGRLVNDPTAAAIKVNGVYVGTDKFEHFMGSGFKYFKTYHLKGKPLKKALAIGYRAETGAMGAITTGVKSYGDLSANFNGMRFWNHVLQLRGDVLGENIGPYISCVDNKYEVVKKIDWASYVDDSFDEGINCSAYTSEKMVKLVNDRVKLIGEKTGQSTTCPMEPEKLDAVKKRYGDIADEIINSRGHHAVY